MDNECHDSIVDLCWNLGGQKWTDDQIRLGHLKGLNHNGFRDSILNSDSILSSGFEGKEQSLRERIMCSGDEEYLHLLVL